MRTLKWIGKTLGRKVWRIVFLCVTQCLMAINGVVFALIMRRVIDNAVARQQEAFVHSIIAMILLIVFQIIIRWFEKYVNDDTCASIENKLRQNAFQKMLRTDYGKMKEYHTGELMNRITSDTSVVTDGAVSLLPSLLSMGVRILGVLIVMWSIEPKIALFFLIGGCFVAVFSMIPRKWQKREHRRVQEADGSVRSFLQESLESLLVIRAFGCESKIEDTSAQKMNTHRRARKRRSNVQNILATGLSVVFQTGYIVGFVWCGLGIMNGTVTYGTLTAVIQVIGQIQTPFAYIGTTFSKYASMIASAERLMELGEHEQYQPKRIETMTRGEAYDKLEKIAFEQVTFSYDGEQNVLRNESFSVKKGEFLAIIGSSGIGKSTIMKLLLSVYRPNEGKVLAHLNDGTYELDQMPEGMFAYVPQGNYLMSGTINQVVGFSERTDEIDKERVKEACRIACASEFIEELPLAYETVLGEHGAGLSEGQMQRLAIARAIYSQCPILLLDEATSALDSETERKMISSIKQMKDYTVLLITHRKEAWELCDRVLERKE